MTDETIDPRAVEAARGVYDDEYEQSTPGAGRWRERTASPCRDLGQPATSLSTRGDRGASNSVDRLAQRHRFGRALDMPPAHNDIDEARWLGWLLLYVAVVIVALIVLWLVMS